MPSLVDAPPDLSEAHLDLAGIIVNLVGAIPSLMQKNEVWPKTPKGYVEYRQPLQHLLDASM